MTLEEQIKLGHKAQAAISYLEEVSSEFEDLLFKEFTTFDLSQGTEYILALRQQYDGLQHLLSMVRSHIDNGKIAAMQLEKNEA